MFESFTQIDTPLEYGESAAAVVLFFVGLAAGNWLGKFIFSFISVILFLGLLAIPIWEISNGILTGWKDISIGSMGLGLIIGIFFFPLTLLTKAYQRIEVLEEKVKATESSDE